MIVLSPAIVLGQSTLLTADNPLICWQQLVTVSSIAATSEESGYPATNLANPATHLGWRATSTALQDLTVSSLSMPISYIAIAKHNLGSAQCPVQVDVADPTYRTVAGPVLLPDDTPAIFVFPEATPTDARLRIDTGSEAPRVSVLYCGNALQVERRIYANHTPLKYAREIDVMSGLSESGNFLGRIVTRERRAAPVKFSLIDPDWYRENFDPFLISAKESPFFFAWRPATYPREAGFAWLTNDPKPVPEPPSNLVGIELQLAGIA